MNLKALALQVLQRNRSGNTKETSGFLTENSGKQSKHNNIEIMHQTSHPVLPVVRSDPKSNPLAEESDKRFDFCEMHRRMMGGECYCADAIDGSKKAGITAPFRDCLLWQIVKAEQKLDRMAGMAIIDGVTLGDCLAKLDDSEDQADLFIRDKRWILCFAETIYWDKT
jgi:hypothetical protein